MRSLILFSCLLLLVQAGNSQDFHSLLQRSPGKAFDHILVEQLNSDEHGTTFLIWVKDSCPFSRITYGTCLYTGRKRNHENRGSRTRNFRRGLAFHSTRHGSFSESYIGSTHASNVNSNTRVPGLGQAFCWGIMVILFPFCPYLSFLVSLWLVFSYDCPWS